MNATDFRVAAPLPSVPESGYTTGKVCCGMRRSGLYSKLLIAMGMTLPCVAAAGIEDDARAILQRRCVACHGPKTKTAGLDLSSRETALRAGGKGPALKPG